MPSTAARVPSQRTSSARQRPAAGRARPALPRPTCDASAVCGQLPGPQVQEGGQLLGHHGAAARLDVAPHLQMRGAGAHGQSVGMAAAGAGGATLLGGLPADASVPVGCLWRMHWRRPGALRELRTASCRPAPSAAAGRIHAEQLPLAAAAAAATHRLPTLAVIVGIGVAVAKHPAATGGGWGGLRSTSAASVPRFAQPSTEDGRGKARSSLVLVLRSCASGRLARQCAQTLAGTPS